jgi:hypothetical protein
LNPSDNRSNVINFICHRLNQYTTSPSLPLPAQKNLNKIVADEKQPHEQVDIILHNMHPSSTFITWRKFSSRTLEETLVDFTRLVEKGVFNIISLSVSKLSFVAVVGCEKNWDEVEGDLFRVTR